MTPAKVLVAATRTSAEILGLAISIDRCRENADFIVLNADPLDDITNARRIGHVYLRGRQVDRVKLAPDFAGRERTTDGSEGVLAGRGRAHLRANFGVRVGSRGGGVVRMHAQSGAKTASGGPMAAISPTRATRRSTRSPPRISARWKSPGGSRPTASGRVPNSSWSRRR